MQNPLSLSFSVTKLKGAGPKIAEKLAGLGIVCIQDLLFHLPYKYQDRTKITPIASLRLGMAVVVEAEIKAATVAFGRRRALLVKIQDGGGLLTLRFFHFSRAQQASLKSGHRIRCYGEVRMGPTGLEMVHPEYTAREEGDFPALENTLTPLYPSSEGLNQIRLRGLIEQALTILKAQAGLPEWLPANWLQEWHLPTLTQALFSLHHPVSEQDVTMLLDGNHPAQSRLALEELLAHHLSLQQIRAQAKSHGAPAIKASENLVPELLAALPFKLTNAQLKVSGEISEDLAKPAPMMRLVQGDVGSGKTLVALVAALQAIEQGFQVALMAPTELLAEQHFRNMQQWCEPLGVSIALLLGKSTKKQRDELLPKLADGSTQLITGTHALFQKGVDFGNLGLIIIDEQHRFGVQQRLSLKEKAINGNPHQLAMTATPIPRTLAMTAFADLDLSVIDELPPGRTPVVTASISQDKRDAVIARVFHAVQEGRQVYWVCTLIEESEDLQAEAAEASANRLAEALPHLRIGLLHGKLKPKDKSHLMNAFKAQELDILVATTVIEVGVDVPNASVMIIENPERLGLSQLHQLRGRVGRGTTESYCLLMYGHPLSEQGKQRLEVMRSTNDGFVIAEEDLKIRGPGEVLGTRQTGAIGFRVADIDRDQHWLEVVPELASKLMAEYPNHVDPIIKRWLFDAERFAQV
ncbi:ATP-dependent DNA helicase RecG [Reinekea forsetii]|nr:ATP-dependent DNA helicase RecG [Reinekea forsetii]